MHELLVGASVLMLIFSVIPLIRNDYWAFRVFEYPRGQKFSITVFLFVCWITQWSGTTLDWVFSSLLAINTGYLFYQLYPYTILAPKQLLGMNHSPKNGAISLLISNVYQYNRTSNLLLQRIDKCQPDVVLLAETDRWWATQMEALHESYPYRVLHPLENTYGMLLYSRLPLSESEVRFLVEEDIPSIRAKVKLASGVTIQLYCLHPTPPVPQENPRSTERDKEILLIAKEAEACELPVIVAGDLNDVAWSYTTELFLKISKLLDPRRGRGWYSTFHAKIPFLRFPLDHIFCSSDFKLVKIKRLPSVNSDHFPMFVTLAYDPAAVSEQNELEATQEDEQLAEEKINADTDSDGPANPDQNPINT